jgi:hypothetical protein
MTSNQGYIAAHATNLVTFTLPASSATGSIVEVTGISGTNGWKIAQAASQKIYFGRYSTTTGVTGYLQCNNVRDVVRILCIVTDLEWQVLYSIGNIEVV